MMKLIDADCDRIVRYREAAVAEPRFFPESHENIYWTTVRRAALITS
jgi:hypothetical protein